MCCTNVSWPTVQTLAVLLGMTALSYGCATPRPATTDAAATADPAAPYVRQVAPFTVLDDQGRPYNHPFLGGLHVPRPQFADGDGDGDTDLFIQEQTGSVMFFENTGTTTEPHFVWRTDAYRDIDVGEWYRFVDLDDDGDPDLLAERQFSYISYYRNEGSATNPRFVLAADTLRDVDGEPIFSDRQNIPNVTDIDCDGLPDLFIGRLIGTITRYEQGGNDENGVPRFRHLTDRFENIEIVGQQMGLNGSLHGANSLAFADIDHDGDQDLFWGDFFEAGLLFIENTGSCEMPVLQDEPVQFPPRDPILTSGYNAPAFTDLDDDGDLDLFIGVLGGAFNPNTTAADPLYYLEHTGDTFELRSKRAVYGIDLGSETIPAFADLDGDGDADLLLTNKLDPYNLDTSYIYHFENTGTPTAPAFRLVGPLPIEGSYHYAPALADLDADGDTDLLLGTWNKGIAFYRNEGTPEAPTFVEEAAPYITLTRGSNSAPALVDIDADGDFDLFVGESSGELNFYRNEGTPQAPNFVLVSDTYEGIDAGRRSYPTFTDLDGDGDFDLILGSENGTLHIYRNDGTPENPAFVLVEDHLLPTPSQALSTPAFIDLDGDGDTDLFTGGIRGGLLYYEHRGSN